MEWSPEGRPIGSGNAYRHWYRYWYGTDEVPGQRWLQPYVVTAPDAETLRRRVGQFEAEAGRGLPRISLPLRARRGSCACVQFYPRAVLSDPMDGVIDNSMPLPRSGRGLREWRMPSLDPRGIERIIAVIDSEIAFAHPRFRRSGDTAIAWFWDQDADAYDVMERTGSRKPTRFGREMYANEIDAYVAAHPRNERTLYEAYRRDSYTDPMFALPPSRFGHGTSVLDAAVGDLLAEDPALAIFAVQLPRFAVGQTQGHFLEVYLRLALERISQLADEIERGGRGGRPEVYVNISVGGHAGRHDGQSRLERLMDRMIEDGEVRAIFLPAGNSRETRTHARYRKEDWKKGCDDLVWRILPDDGTPSFLEIWLPDASGGVGIEVTTPTGLRYEWDAAALEAGQCFQLDDGPDALARLYVEDDPPVTLRDEGEGVPPRRRIVLAVRQTARATKAARCRRDGRPDLSGDWRIRLDATKMKAERPIINVWVSRDEPIFRLRTGGRQSYFPGPPIDEQSPPESGVVTDGSLSDLATGRHTIVVAAVRSTDLEPSDYSSEGISRENSVVNREVLPTVAAVADRSRSLPGLLTIGYFAGSHVRLGGTSVSAPVALNSVLRDARRGVGAYGKGPPDVTASLKSLVDSPAPGDEREKRRIGRGAIRDRRRRP